MNILVVDDKQQNIDALVQALYDVDAEIHTALSGNNALELILKND